MAGPSHQFSPSPREMAGPVGPVKLSLQHPFEVSFPEAYRQLQGCNPHDEDPHRLVSQMPAGALKAGWDFRPQLPEEVIPAFRKLWILLPSTN